MLYVSASQTLWRGALIRVPQNQHKFILLSNRWSACRESKKFEKPCGCADNNSKIK